MKTPFQVIKTLRVTEKATDQQNKSNQYQVVVEKHANKVDIKQAVERAFKVKVLRVNTLHVRGKARRQRTAQAGFAPAWKKAIVTLKTGDKIEVA
ncbi:MAG: 50S ribosomal protein L23 [Verrucomicrobiae bacterium]|nr:50S ribosomal protein L23 [Verrucomicrobiae bacterium]